MRPEGGESEAEIILVIITGQHNWVDPRRDMPDDESLAPPQELAKQVT